MGGLNEEQHSHHETGQWQLAPVIDLAVHGGAGPRPASG